MWWATGLFGLLGVLVGGLITAGTQFGLVWWRQQGDFLVGIRLLEAGLERSRAIVRSALQSDEWFDGRTDPVVAPYWREYSAAVAKGLRGDEWHFLTLAIVASEEVGHLFADRLRGG